MDKNKTKKIGNCERTLATYMVLFAALKPITTSLPQYSTLILAACAIMLVLFVLFSSKTLSFSMGFVSIVFCVFMFLLADVLFRPNSSQSELLYNFLIYGVLPLFLLSKVEDVKQLAYAYAWLTVIVGIVYLVDPLNSYKWSSNYMTFGFSAMLPAVCGCLIMIHMFEKKKFWCPMLIFALASLIFANKGVFLSEIAMIATAYILFTKNSTKRFLIIVALLIAVFYIYPILSAILDFAAGIADSLSIDSYALDTFSVILKNTNSNSVYDSRLDIWKIAFDLFSENPFLGHGAGFFDSHYNGYTHNVFLDVMVAYGSVGLVFLGIIIVASVSKIRKMSDRHLSVFAALLFMSWLFPLQVSSYFWSTLTFWLYWGICFFDFKHTEKNVLSD